MFRSMTDAIRHNPAALHYGAAVADLDRDGENEILVTGFGGPNRLLKWRDGELLDIADDILADAERAAIGVCCADIDGDGEEEIYILNSDTFMGPKRFADRLFDRQGGEWVDLFELPENQAVLNQTSGRSVCAIDRAGTGRYGFLVANYGGPMRLYEATPEGILVDVAQEAGLALTTGGRALISLPILGGRPDIFAANEHSANFLFANQGDGTFIEMASVRGLDDAREHGRGIAALDGGEGRFDLVYGNWEGPHRLMQQGPSKRFTDIAPASMAQPSRIRTVLAFDAANTGTQAVFFHNIGEPNRAFQRAAGGAWQAVHPDDAYEPDGLGTGGIVADIDGDGRLEMLLTHGEQGRQPLSLYRGPATDAPSLRVAPTLASGAPARGAVVALEVAEREHPLLRTIDAGSGYLCQMEPVAHFGIGGLTPRSLEVRWPNGTTSRHEIPTDRAAISVVPPTDEGHPTNG